MSRPNFYMQLRNTKTEMNRTEIEIIKQLLGYGEAQIYTAAEIKAGNKILREFSSAVSLSNTGGIKTIKTHPMTIKLFPPRQFE